MEKTWSLVWIGKLPTDSIDDETLETFTCLLAGHGNLSHIGVMVKDGELTVVASKKGLLLSAACPAVLAAILHASAAAGLETLYVTKHFSMELEEEE